ncbi:MAG: AraC family transcriptional regulator ligand-binding domain-containing protein [Aquabacterium sp.]|uniref:AraC family transcriptional regulator n=1 Tax=Aquabacterium sp. TaxID=1872578 RepID=UPI0025B8FA57|nr:AraC family transcriptional regulator [Aquabacterium sp.]MBI5925177.1 AraC family transcriptional regulator ligand-binding domain-containing protein [Aquabacterium sp.]
MLISPINLRVLATTLDMEGYDSKVVLNECGIQSLEDLDDTIWLPLGLYERMVQAALKHTQTPGFGLTAGTSLANQRYGLHPMLVMHMPSLRQGLQDVIRFTPLLLAQPELSLQECNDKAKLIIAPILKQGAAAIYRAEFIAVCMLQMLRYGSGNSIKVSQIHFAHPAPAHESRYNEAFGSGIFFNSPENAIIFNSEVLDQPLPWHDRVSYLEYKTKAELSLSASLHQVDLVQRAKNVLINAFPNAPSMDEVASQMGTSKRSLRRHLAYRGTSHTELVKECRQLIAEHRLSDTNSSLKQIAGELGFSSVTCFHRAFKNWTGRTPQEWRDEQVLAVRRSPDLAPQAANPS